jgi:hypothetical protein
MPSSTATALGSAECPAALAQSRNVAQEVANYAKYLGMHPVLDRELLWIAECALTAPVPGESSKYAEISLPR